jgi:ketosteroid isomerase-like protein
MTTQRAIDEADIRQRLEKLVEAIRAMDLERVKPIDIVPPLQHVGAESKWQNWADVFAAYRPPLGYEIRGLTIFPGNDVAFAHILSRISGTLRTGKSSDYWVRWTTCFRKVDGKNWLIAHDHISVPIDVKSGEALLSLEP